MSFLESIEVKGHVQFNELQQNALQSVVDDRGILLSVFYASAKGWSSMSAVNKCSSNLFIEAASVAYGASDDSARPAFYFRSAFRLSQLPGHTDCLRDGGA